MADAVRVANRDGWVPVTRIYQVPGGFLAVSRLAFITAAGTEVFLVDSAGTEITGRMEPLARFPAGTSHEEALGQLGFDNVVDDIGPEPEPAPPDQLDPEPAQSVLDMLPPEMAAVIGNNLNGSQ